jgi:potassium-transporting ATPase KdpC subunit
MIRTAIMMLLLLTAVTGFVYPLAMTGMALVLFPDQASGSLIREDGRVIGSRLLGQQFNDPKYFWPRPSATSPSPYNAASSSGSNYGPLSPARQKAMDARRQMLQDADPTNKAEIPIDLLTSSASGLDPHITPAAAEYQANRIARARGLHIAVVRTLIAAHTAPREWGFLGEPAVNVVSLNRALDQQMK